jgi:hypothetical protein
MKVKSTLVIACLALALLMTVGTTAAQAQDCPCLAQWIVGAPYYVTAGAMMLTAAIITAPFSWTGCSSGNCGFSFLCNCNIFPKCNLFSVCNY